MINHIKKLAGLKGRLTNHINLTANQAMSGKTGSSIRNLTVALSLVTMSNNLMAAPSSGTGIGAFKTGIALAVGIIMLLIFVWSIVRVWKGWSEIDRGEEGYMKIISGFGAGLSVILIGYYFTKIGLGNAVISAEEINTALGGTE